VVFCRGYYHCSSKKGYNNTEYDGGENMAQVKKVITEVTDTEKCIFCNKKRGLYEIFPEDKKQDTQYICESCLSEKDDEYNECVTCKKADEKIAYQIDDLSVSDYDDKYYCKEHYDPNGGEGLSEDKEDLCEYYGKD